MTRYPSIVVIVLSAATLSSCGTMDSIKTGAVASANKVGAGFSKVGQSVGDGFGKVADVTTSPFRPGLPVVEAREEDLREVQSGHDQALAYQAEQQRRSGWWIFGGSVDFQEPELPAVGEPVNAGLLPEKAD